MRLLVDNNTMNNMAFLKPHKFDLNHTMLYNLFDLNLL